MELKDGSEEGNENGEGGGVQVLATNHIYMLLW